MMAAKKKELDASIIIPAYNEEKYIGACLGSIKRQKFAGRFEVILGDGNSKDSTRQIAKDYGARVVLENYGTPSGGRYAATKIARGKILVFVSADVEISPNYLTDICGVFSNRKVAWAMARIAPSEGNAIEKFGAWILNGAARILNPLGIAYVNADCLAARADSYHRVGGFNPKLVTSEDTDLGKRLMWCGKFAYASKAVSYLSMRRVRKWGYFRFVVFHTTNFFKTHLFSSAAERYDPVR